MAKTDERQEAAGNIKDTGKVAAGLEGEGFLKRMRVGEKALFFFGNACIYVMHTFALNSFAVSWKINYLKLGAATAFSFMNMLGSLLASHYNDRTKNPKKTLLVGTILYALTFSLLFGVQVAKNKNLMGMKDSLGGMLGLFLFIGLFTIGNMFSSMIYPSLDTSVMAMTHKIGASKESFGRQRMFGVIGHSATTIFTEYFVEEFKLKGDTLAGNRAFPNVKSSAYERTGGYMLFVIDIFQYAITWLIDYCSLAVWWMPSVKKSFLKDIFAMKGAPEMILLAIFTVIFCTLVYFIIPTRVLEYLVEKNKKEDGTYHSKEEEAKKREVYVNDMYKNPQIISFFALVIAMGIGRCIITYYLVFYSEAVKHVTKTPVSVEQKPFMVFSIVKAVAEVVCYPLEKWLITVLGSPAVLSIIGAVLCLLRLGSYGLIQAEYFVLIGILNETMKGLSSGLFFCGAIRYIRDRVPGEIMSTAQGALSGVFMGFTGLIGGVLTGSSIHYLIKNKTSSSKYSVLNDTKTLIEIDAKVHLEAFQLFLLVITGILFVMVGCYSVYLYLATKRDSTKKIGDTKTEKVL
ncbi:MAG: uncharacterized protein A8A55_0782 [Amphiamblys sp. WSBS2006]|nr:MAG: uncharacterized protein A8A55_0782 [Amphiamblys sp. WSBS2006]